MCEVSKEQGLECSCNCHKHPVEINHHEIIATIWSGKVKDEGPEPERLDKTMEKNGLL